MSGTQLATERCLDWRNARDVQRRFMQPLAATFGALDSSAHCRQVHELGGDCYGFIPIDRERLAFMIGDASGKGLAAALMISNVQSSLRTAAIFNADNGAEVIRAVNSQVYASSLADRYATLFYGVFDPASSQLRYVNAGHNPPMIIRRDGSVHWLETGGAPVGMFPDWTYENGAVELYPGDLLIAYTDGVVEAFNRDGEQWGVEGLRRAVAERPGLSSAETVRSIFAAMDEFSGGCQADDATVAVLRVPESQSAWQVARAA